MGPLQGLKVLDLGAVVLAPYCGLLLGQMGAEVIKVERPSGDITRNLGPSRSPGMSGSFMLLNDMKRSIALDLTHREGRSAFQRIAATADVVLHNMRTTAAAALGLTYAQLAAVNPRIIVVAAHGYSDESDDAGRAAYDDLIQAASGLAYLEGQRHGEPSYVAATVADKAAAMSALYATLAALYERERSGLGQDIEVPMYDVFASFVTLDHVMGETFIPRLGPAFYGRMMSPSRRPYPTSDGYIAAMPYTDEQWASFFDQVGRAELRADERFSNITKRTENIDVLYAILAHELTKRTTEQWMETFHDIDVPASRVNSVMDILNDDGLAERGVVGSYDHPTEGRVRSYGLPVSFKRTVPERSSAGAPNLGQHGRDILREVGYSDQEVDALVRAHVLIERPSSESDQ
jgi:crotonobetainyl-CoA:carnitine CoA-transferase CaiB-like acyl-CoA transferase